MSSISKETFNKYKKNRKQKEKVSKIQKITLFTVIILVIIAIIILIVLTNKTKKKLLGSTSLPTYAENLDQVKFNDTVEEVRDKSELRRMKIYLGEFLDNVENKNYEEIYTRLDGKFKENFFPKKQVLIDYLEGEFPKSAGYVIKNFERIGTLYVLIVDLGSVVDTKNKKDMKFVFEEYGLNDYKFSFSKI